MLPKRFCKGGLIFQCKHCKKVFHLGEWMILSWATEVRARMEGCTFKESDCGCAEEEAIIGFA